jgi:hypothetical protein
LPSYVAVMFECALAASAEVKQVAVAVPVDEEKLALGVPPVQAIADPLSEKVTSPVMGTKFPGLTGFTAFVEIVAVRVTGRSTVDDIGELGVVIAAVVAAWPTLKSELVAESDRGVVSAGLRETVAARLRSEPRVVERPE